MAFNSLTYCLFLPVIYLAFTCTCDRLRYLVLLLASYGFYAALNASYLPGVLLLVTTVSYACGLRIAAARDDAQRGRWFWSGVVACLAVLAVMKYPLFAPFKGRGGLGDLLSPVLINVGVSYYVFQAVSYLADLYLEIEEPEPHFGKYALYLAFFPKLLQGPIERAGDLLPQLSRPYRFDYDRTRSGLLLFAGGLFKKCVLADRLALLADQVYGNVHHHAGLALLVGTYAYALQLYFDFAGYTDMARGAARLFGIELTPNFNNPYQAASVAEFWRRWHISFSRWILDYIFKPLQIGWRNLGQAGTALALLVTFLVSGVWHGATWGFVAWGGLHGLYLACSTLYRPYQKKLQRRLGIEKSPWLTLWQQAVTFNLVCFAWIFFRAASLSDAWYVVRHLADLSGDIAALRTQGALQMVGEHLMLGRGKAEVLVLVLALAGWHLVYRFREIRLFEKPIAFRWACYCALLVGILFLKSGSGSTFIYNQF